MDLATLETKLGRCENLPPLPQVATKVMEITDQPDCSARILQKAIEQDPAIAARVLSVAGSAYYGRREMNDLCQAVTLLGMARVRNLVLGLVYQRLVEDGRFAGKLSGVSFWRHSLATAVAARIIAALRHPSKVEEAHCAGLLHDVGLLVLDRLAPDESIKVLEYCEREQVPIRMAERALYPYDHAALGAILAERWRLPGPIAESIALHHNASQAISHKETVAIVAVASTLAARCGFGIGPTSRSAEFNPFDLQFLELPEEQLGVLPGVLAAEIAKAESAFGINQRAA